MIYRRLGMFAVLLVFVSTLRGAEEFGDISVSAAAMYSGNTFHGYAEMRVTLENRSHGKAHRVTLVYPNNAWNSGNSISRLSRSVTLEPGAREVVLLLQPPLPANGDNSIRVEVDNRHEGEVRAPNANNHCNYSTRGGRMMATVFISRSLDYDAVERVFQANRGAFTAAMAVGAPDSTASGGGYQPTSWMPDTRRGGQTNWLELDYATPQAVEKIVIYSMVDPTSIGFMVLVGVSGTNVATIPLPSGRSSWSGSRRFIEYYFPTTSEPVKMLRLDFERRPPHSVAIDAVQISGPSGSQWASGARASSDNSAATGRNADSIESLRAESPVAEWSENWLAYSPFDAIVLNAVDMNLMSPAVLAAIGDYLWAGGNVVLSGRTDLPAAWHPLQKSDLPDGLDYSIGLGRCFALGSVNSSVLDPKSLQTLRDAVRASARYWQILPGSSEAANVAMPVVENMKVPTRGIVIMMLAFIIFIGPVNILYLNRRQRRTWMLWTIPAISFATTLFVFAYSLLREGVTPNTRIAGLTLLDQASHRAATIGSTAFYCPLTPSGGLHFDFATEATPLVRIGYDSSGSSREVDWSQSQHFSRGWVSARVPVHFHLRRSETRRERLQIVNENGGLQIVNGLGAAIKSLWVADSDMKFYEAREIAAGQKAGLILSKQPQTPGKSGAEGLWRDISFTARPDLLNEGTKKYLLPNTYIAVLDGNPFIENALGSSASPKRTKSSAVVFGILESPEPK